MSLARAGVNLVQPQPPHPETLATDSTLFVDVPLDLVMSYHARATKAIQEVHSSKQFEWLRVRDEAERQLWVEKHRSGLATLGVVVRQTMLEREAMWMCSAEDKVGITRATHATPAQKPPASPSKRDKGGHKKGGGGQIVTVDKLLDVQQLCSRWNQGACKEPCPAGRVHACNAKVKANGRACGLRNHKSTECKHTLRE